MFGVWMTITESDVYPIDWSFSVTFSNGYISMDPPESVVSAIDSWLNEYELEICCECGRSVRPDIPNYKSRVSEGTDILTRKENKKPFPLGAWLCAKCNINQSVERKPLSRQDALR